MTATSNGKKPTTLWEFLNTLISTEIQPPSSIHDKATPPWHEPGNVYEVDARTYFYFLELLPPRWTDGNLFAFGEGAGPFRLFWKVRDSYLVRELTELETRTFCDLSGAALYE